MTAFRLRMVRGTFVLFMLLLLCGLSAAPLVHAQTLSFEKTWGGTSDEGGSDVAVDGSGNNIYVAGSTYSFGAGSYDVVLLRYDSSGGLVWQRTWGGTGDDGGDGVAVDGSDSIYVTGSTKSFGAGGWDVVLLKFDSSGGLIWQKTWGGADDDEGLDVVVDGSGNIYVTGITYSSGVGLADVVLLKFDPSGGLVWQRTWGDTSNDFGRGVAVDGSGNIYVTGSTYSFGAGFSDVVLLKFNSSGILVWEWTWGGTDYDDGSAVAVDGSGNNIYVAGSTYSFGAGSYDVVLLRYDSSGGLVWQRTWGGTGDDEGYGVAVDGSGGIYVSGWTLSFGAGSWDVVLLKYDSTGGLLWQKIWGGTNADYGYGVALDSSGDVYFVGSTHNAARTLNAVSGTVINSSGSVYSPFPLPLHTPTFVPATPAGTVNTPNGNETYAGGSDVFLLRFSVGAGVEALQGFADLPTGNVLLVVGDIALNPHGSKPSGVGYQQGRDTTPLGFVSGMLVNSQPTKFDTNTAWIGSDGRPLNTTAPTLIFGIGGPGINAVTHYYETTSTVGDQAPVRFGYNSTYFYWTFTSSGAKVPGSEILQSSTAVPPGASDVFVIQTLRDANGRLVVLMYGTRYTGTWAAAWTFKYFIYPNISQFTDSYYIVRWTDAASGPDADYTPSPGDTLEPLAQG